MSESCNSRHFSWLMKSCFPNQQDPVKCLSPNPIIQLSSSSAAAAAAAAAATISALPDDLLLECLSRVPSSSLRSLSLVCRRWSLLLLSPSFLSLRRLHSLLHPTLFVLSSSSNSSPLLSASIRFPVRAQGPPWRVSSCQMVSADNLSHFRLSAIGPRIYIIRRDEMFCYDTWSGVVLPKSSTIFTRKKFAVATVAGKIYIAGGEGSSAAAGVEEYDPDGDTWCLVSQVPRRRYGCIGAAVDGVFYVIGGLKIGGPSGMEVIRLSGTAGAEAHVYASSMDLYDVEARSWLRSRTVPGGGCMVAACAVGGYVYILTSHAVELSFWRFDARRNGVGFGEWTRTKSPPLPPQVRLDSTVRFSCVGVENKVVLIQVIGNIDDLLRRSGRRVRGSKEGLVLVYDCISGEWSRGPDLPGVIRRAACVSVEC